MIQPDPANVIVMAAGECEPPMAIPTPFMSDLVQNGLDGVAIEVSSSLDVKWPAMDSKIAIWLGISVTRRCADRPRRSVSTSSTKPMAVRV